MSAVGDLFAVEVAPPERGTTRVVPRGELDIATAPELEGWLDDLRRECADVTIDLGELAFVDSTGLRVLLRAAAEARRAKVGLRFTRPSRPLRRALEAAGMQDELPLV